MERRPGCGVLRGEGELDGGATGGRWGWVEGECWCGGAEEVGGGQEGEEEACEDATKDEEWGVASRFGGLCVEMVK